MKKKVMIMLSILLTFTMCKKKGVEEITTQGLPVLTTQEVREIGTTSAICGGEVTDDGGAEVTARGVCWSTSENPTIADFHTTDGSGTGSYTSNMTGLSVGTTYYVRAYATNSCGTSYGSQKSFTTSAQFNGHDFEDLGLPSGLKWATCNVGASSPSEYGNYYAWGEIEPKESYTQQNCLTWELIKGDISGNPGYDAARANLGGAWRMPTIYEFEELVEECEWEWTNEGGNNGYKVTGPNGNSIFLPAAGDCYGTSLNYAGSYGFYWSSTSKGSICYAYDLNFLIDDYDTYWNDRSRGRSVRPVLANQIIVTTKEVTEVNATTAICGGEVMDDGGAEVTARGVCWSTSENPTIRDSHTTDGSGTGSYTSNMTGLAENTIYYVRAYATNEKGTSYGEEKTFTTKDGIAEITTKEVTEIGTTSAICGGEVMDDGGAEVTARGVCWSTSENPTTRDTHTTDGSGTGSYTSNITGLTENTTYYVRAYATNSYGTSYGSQKSFNTASGQIHGYDYVDLGLSSGLKWATCNVGAISPSEYGNYYAWGEVEPKESYTQQNCVTSGQVIGDISGNPQYDAARANWGSTWRMPTIAEFRELINNCTWTWTSEGGNNGYRVTGPNGNSIFLPAAGRRDGTSLNFAGSYGFYWSSAPNESNTHYAYYLYFYSDGHGTDCYSRSDGLSVRPVSE